MLPLEKAQSEALLLYASIVTLSLIFWTIGIFAVKFALRDTLHALKHFPRSQPKQQSLPYFKPLATSGNYSETSTWIGPPYQDFDTYSFSYRGPRPQDPTTTNMNHTNSTPRFRRRSPTDEAPNDDDESHDADSEGSSEAGTPRQEARRNRGRVQGRPKNHGPRADENDDDASDGNQHALDTTGQPDTHKEKRQQQQQQQRQNSK
ncbi:MAG: hypothetical protein Q9182_001296 [Xanthomendoza sp. 2 TL-2023]